MATPHFKNGPIFGQTLNFSIQAVGIQTDKGVISVIMTYDGAILNLKDMFNTDWAGTTLELHNTEEYRFRNNGSSYRMRVDAGLFLVNNSMSYFPPKACYGTPYTQAVTMAPESKSQFFTTYHMVGPWVLSDWQQKMFCCLKTTYTYTTGQAAIVDLRLKRHLLQNITAALLLPSRLFALRQKALRGAVAGQLFVDLGNRHCHGLGTPR